MTLRQCAAFRPDGEQCKRVAQEGSDYCYSHRMCVEEKPADLQPLPEGKIRLVSASAWAICEFCGDAYPQADLFRDGNRRLTCGGCYVRAVLKDADKANEIFVRTLAQYCGISLKAAVVELCDMGFYEEMYGDELFFIKPRPKP